MNMTHRRILRAAALAALIASVYTFRQPVRADEGGLVLTPSSEVLTPTQIAQSLAGPDVVISNVAYQGSPLAVGTFSGGTGILNRADVDESPLESGITLSSGKIADAVGPNKLSFTTTNFCIPTGTEPPACVPNGDLQLDQIVAPEQTFDAAVLEFDFVPPVNSNVVKFRYVFTSEEYNEFANSRFNNVFGFYINGLNYALLPDGITPVSINNVNGGNPFGTDAHNPGFFRNNEGTVNVLTGMVTGAPINIEADGLTVIMTFRAPVIPGFTNHMKLAIADTRDHVYDSWAFLEQATFFDVPEVCGNQIDDDLDGFIDEGCSQTSDAQTITSPGQEHTFPFTNLGKTETIVMKLTENTTLRPHSVIVIATILDPRDLLLPLSNPAVFPFGTTCLPTNTTDGSQKPCVFFQVVDSMTFRPPIAGVDYSQSPGAIIWKLDIVVTKPVNGNVGMGHFRSDMVTSPVDYVDENIITIFDAGVGESDNYSGVVMTVTPTTAPPTLSLPGLIVAEATGPSGAMVDYVAKAYGTVPADPPFSEATFKAIPIDCHLGTPPSETPAPSGSLFPLGDTVINCSATTGTGADLKTTNGSFTVRVLDTTKPSLGLPTPIRKEATGPNGAIVEYVATAHDIVDLDFFATCNPPSGSTFALGTTTVNCSGTDTHGNSNTGSFTVTITDTTPPTIKVPADILFQATSATGAVVPYSVTATDLVDTSVTLSCTPPSGSLFPIGETTVTCTATDDAGNKASKTFKVTVNAPDGRMYGVGHINEGNKHHHFAFRVAQLGNRDYGRLEYWVNDPHRCSVWDDDYDRHGDNDGDHDNDFGRDHRSPPSRFESTSITSVIFSDNPAFQPNGRSRGSKPTVDTVQIKGKGKWNGQPGYTFEAKATDRGEPGRHRDTFSLVIMDSHGRVVASVNVNETLTLDGGNIQSTRLGW